MATAPEVISIGEQKDAGSSSSGGRLYETTEADRVQAPAPKITSAEAARLVKQTGKAVRADLSRMTPDETARHQSLLISLSRWHDSKIYGAHLASMGFKLSPPVLKHMTVADLESLQVRVVTCAKSMYVVVRRAGDHDKKFILALVNTVPSPHGCVLWVCNSVWSCVDSLQIVFFLLLRASTYVPYGSRKSAAPILILNLENLSF